MERQLTTVDIMGISFYVDAHKEELRQQDNPKNRIPFQVFDQNGDGYRFLYDSLRMNVPLSREAVREDPERYRWAIIPALMELDPEGIALRYDIPLEVLCPKNRSIIPKAITATLRPIRIYK